MAGAVVQEAHEAARSGIVCAYLSAPDIAYQNGLLELAETGGRQRHSPGLIEIPLCETQQQRAGRAEHIHVTARPRRRREGHIDLSPDSLNSVRSVSSRNRGIFKGAGG